MNEIKILDALPAPWKPCFIRQTREEYDRDLPVMKFLNWSLLKWALTCWADMRDYQTGKLDRKDTDTMKQGRADHVALLENCEWSEHFPPRIIERAEDMREAAMKRAVVKNLVDGALKELTVVWLANEGVWCKGRLDIYCEPGTFPEAPEAHSVYEYKSSPRISIGPVGNSFSDLRYDCQAAFQTMGVEAVVGTAPGWGILAQEREGARRCRIFEPSEIDISRGEPEVRRLLAEYLVCLEADEWPEYGPEGLGLKPWVRKKSEEMAE